MGEPPPDNSHNLMSLLQTTGMWRASSIDCEDHRQTPTGFPELDALLPGGGWPVAGVSEMLHDYQGIGEFRLLMPGLAHLSQTGARWLLLVSPPYIPYPPALKQAGIDLSRIVITRPSNERDYLWVMEKALSSQSCSAVIAWPSKLQSKQIRRLQVASKDGDSWGILFRPSSEAANPSPAELRIHMGPAQNVRDNSSISVKVLKRRGSWESEQITLHFDDELQRPMPDFSEMQIRQSAVSDQASNQTRDQTQDQTQEKSSNAVSREADIIEADFPASPEHRLQ